MIRVCVDKKRKDCIVFCFLFFFFKYEFLTCFKWAFFSGTTRLRNASVTVKFVTNTTKESKRNLLERLHRLNFDVQVKMSGLVHLIKKLKGLLKVKNKDEIVEYPVFYFFLFLYI